MHVYRLSRRKQGVAEYFDCVSGEEDWEYRFNCTNPANPHIRQNSKEMLGCPPIRIVASFLGTATLLVAIFSSSHPQARMLDLGRANLAPCQSQSLPSLRQGAYSSDCDHIWNRLFRLFYLRHGRDGRQYGGDELDPYLWRETRYLLDGSSHDQALKLLDEFLQQHSERLITDPLKRGLFQRDLLAVNDWLSLPNDEQAQGRSELQKRIAQVIQIKSYEDAPYLVLATRKGLVKKTKLTDFDSNRSGGIVAVNLRDGDELVGAVLCSSEEDLLLVSANGQSIRFSATDDALRPMGRATSGVQGMRFNTDDYLLSLNVVSEGTYLLVATAGGYAKRTAIEEYTAQGRGGKGILTIQYDTRRGKLVGALIVDDDSEVYAITSVAGVIRTKARQVRKAGRQTKGVRLMNLGEGATLLAIARNAEETGIADEDSDAEPEA